MVAAARAAAVTGQRTDGVRGIRVGGDLSYA
jgi:hypothetical protein